MVQSAHAQVDVDLPQNPVSMLRVDSQYIKSYRYHFTTRLYSSRKYTAFTLPNSANKPILFRPNNTFNLGVGLTYRGFSLNLGYGFPFVNGNASKRGKTQNLDLQMHMYARKHVLDVYGQLYKGFYNSNGVVAQHNGYFSDANTDLLAIGFNYTRVLNHQRFSMRNGANQDERQLRSAGSFLYGAEGLFNKIKNYKNPIVSTNIQDMDLFHDVKRIVSFNIGPNIGYGYNYVFGKYFFLSGAATVGTNFSYCESEGNTHRSFGTFTNHLQGGILHIAPSAAVRLSAGIHTDRWGIIGYYVHQTTTTYVQKDYLMSNSVGNYRVNFIWRFLPNKTLKKVFKPYEWIFK